MRCSEWYVADEYLAVAAQLLSPDILHGIWRAAEASAERGKQLLNDAFHAPADRSEFNTRSLVRIMQDRCTRWLHDLCADRVVLRALTLSRVVPSDRAYTRPARCEVSPRRPSAESL
jgi:hypothetical protein